jgi:hypothetical protein
MPLARLSKRSGKETEASKAVDDRAKVTRLSESRCPKAPAAKDRTTTPMAAATIVLLAEGGDI